MVDVFDRHEVRFDPRLAGCSTFVRHSDYAALEEQLAARTGALSRAISLVEAVITNDPNEPVSDAGHTALDAWQYELESLKAALSPAPEAQQEPVAYPLAKFGNSKVAPLGLYRVHWKSGGSSLAAIGMMENGDRWIAPTNWVHPGTVASAGEWGDIERLEPIQTTRPSEQAVTEAMVEAVQRIRKTAMRQSLVARIPECGEFGGIAQDADWLLDTLKAAMESAQ